MPVVVRRLEVAVGRRLEEERKLARIDAKRERLLRGVVGADPGEELPLHLEGQAYRRSWTPRRRELSGDLADGVPVGHGRDDSLGALVKTWIGIGASFAVAVTLGTLHYTDANAVLQFVVGIIALALLAWTVGVGTEVVASRFGPATTGVLQSTLGNLPELFIVIFALRAGEIVVAQTSILGSLLANALLVLGLAIIAGASGRRTA